jgi:pantetheine-phosphate adenylyltransferase
MKKIAVCPGSFDPITRGHESIIRRALPLFDEIIIAIGINVEKKGFFLLENRLEWITHVFKNEPKIKVESYEGLTVDFCRKVDAAYLIRGLRTSSDFEFERSIAHINKQLFQGIETVFLLTQPEYMSLNSSIVREIVRYNGDASQFVPEGIILKKP